MADTVTPIVARAAEDYPARYYASYDLTASQPTVVTGWYDCWDMSSLALVPPADQMIALTQEQWNDPTFRVSSGKGVQEGRIVDYVPPLPPVPLRVQAQNAMAKIHQQAALATAMGQVFGPEMRDYVRKLRVILDGTDTLGTELPTPPEAPDF